MLTTLFPFVALTSTISTKTYYTFLIAVKNVQASRLSSLICLQLFYSVSRSFIVSCVLCIYLLTNGTGFTYLQLC